ncbi:efflux RND transporter periplasmic adaptor subunit [Marisediminicola sp. LYQ85]|uniref:efflux RND transporter periplasmic adaptor subunit n=1 Tax=Marisediminicola sp. LYQ85 TaxID=3391062 RepID=UPI0039834C26
MTIRERMRQSRRRTRVIAAASLAILLAAGCVYWFGVAVPASTAESRATPVTATASLETLDRTVETSGTVSSAVDESVGFEASGTVTVVEATEGSVVAKGDVLASLDTLTMESALLDARASLAEARATLASSTSSSDGGTAALARIAADEAAVSVAEESVSDAEDALGATTLVAPVAGVVTSVGVAVGDSITATASGSTDGVGAADSADSVSGSAASPAATSTATSDTATSSAAFTIVGTDSWTVAATIGETDVPLVDADDQVELTLADGSTFFGTVAEVGLLPATDSGAAAYPVTIAVTGDAEGLHDGVTADASIVYERRTDVLAVPSAAVTTDGDFSTVTLVDADGVESEAPVTVGDTVGDLVEIVDGLVEGDEVVVTVFTPAGSEPGVESGERGTGDFPGGGMTPPDGVELPSGGFPGGDLPTGGFGPGTEG